MRILFITTLMALLPLQGYSMEQHSKKAIFAGGCFWCMEAAFDYAKGISSTISGFSGGNEKDPSYKHVTSGSTGHVEALQVTYDPTVISYEDLLDIYWQNIDPFDEGGQFFDRGTHYRTVIFYNDDSEKAAAEKSKKEAETRLGKPVAPLIQPAGEFYKAEEYHQDYHKKNPTHYNRYKNASGREQKLKEIWKK